MNIKRGLMIAAAGALLSIGGMASASAAPWNPPHRAQLNQRLDNQNSRIDRALREHRISWRQAERLHRRVRVLRYEIRSQAHDGGYLSVAERRTLNRQESRLSDAIYRRGH